MVNVCSASFVACTLVVEKSILFLQEKKQDGGVCIYTVYICFHLGLRSKSHKDINNTASSAKELWIYLDHCISFGLFAFSCKSFPRKYLQIAASKCSRLYFQQN